MKFIKFLCTDEITHVVNINKIVVLNSGNVQCNIMLSSEDEDYIEISQNTFDIILEKLEDLGHEIIPINSLAGEDLARRVENYRGSIPDAILRSEIPTTGIENREYYFTADDIPF